MKIFVFFVLLFLTISVFADHSEVYKTEIKPAEVIDTITPLIIDVYTDYNSGKNYKLSRKIVYPLTHKKYKVVKREGKPDSLIEIKNEFWCNYPKVTSYYDLHAKIRKKRVTYKYFQGQFGYSPAKEHLIIKNDTIWVVGPDSSLSIMGDPNLNSNNNKDSIDTEKNLSKHKEKSISKEKKQKTKTIFQRIKDFFSK